MSPRKKAQAANAADSKPDIASRKADATLQQRYSRVSVAVACLVRVLEHHGLVAPQDAIRKQLTATLSNDDVINFLDVAEQFGLTGRPMVLTTAEWPDIPTASILHWGAENLVVLESYHHQTIVIDDPIRGTRQVGLAEFRRQFTGVVLVFEPTPPPSPKQD